MPKEPDQPEPDVEPEAKPKPKQAQAVCGVCSGRGLVSVGVHDVQCDACDGTGYA